MTNVVYILCRNTIIIFFLQEIICQSTNANDFEGNSCPSDSIFSNDNRCECSPKKCAESATSCNFGFVRTLTHQGTNKPGDCCDIYQCIQNSSKDCSNVICPGIPSCPPDSYQLPTHKSLDDCCAVAQGCQCLPNCEQPNCSPDLVPVIQEEATKKPGRCCPLYNCEKQELQEESHDCLNGDNNYMKNGTVWTSADFCTKCTCVEGKPICHSFACAPCVKPVKVAGQCCPRCDDIHIQPQHCPPTPNCTKRCLNGNVKDDNDCVSCECRDDCPSECRYIVDENGNKNCECNEKLFAKCENMENCEKNCPFGYKKDKNDCRVCECKKCSKQCSHGYLSNEKGFSICNCKPWNLTSWMKPTINETFSCKIDTNVLREDGETWFDGCRQCSCISGKEMCSLIRCSPFSCSNPIINSTSSCCPFCPDDPFKNEEMNHMVCTSPNGGIMLEGETLMLDNCTQCVCHRGMALCRSKDCPATPCPNPRPPSDGECCATCAVSDNVYDEPPNSYSGNDVHCTASQINATIWREGSCVSCRCVRNKKRCYTELCDVFNKCEHSLTIKGKCCPICVADADRYRFERMCVYDNSTYKNGEEWTLDACTKCKCVYGHLECTQKICSKSCTNAVRKSDKCCLSCSDEENADFRNDQEIFYIVILLMMVCGGIILAICLTRHWRSKKQQIRLRDLGCLPPQYQYKYIPNNPYDNKNGSQKSEKASLAPV